MGLQSLILIAIAGFAAQLVDGGLGMGFGATSMTILTTWAMMAPATASAVVNTAQLGTTVVSGFSHWRFGNVDWRIVALIGIPGAIGAFVGATLLSHISLKAATPLTASILAGIGFFLIYRFSRGKVQRESSSQTNPALLSGLGILGGFISSSGGAGWGPVTTSALLAGGRIAPRRVVGTVSTAEIMVTIAAVIAFVLGLWEELVANLAAAMALLVGGVLAAPLAAWAVSRLNSSLLGGAVGTLLVLLNLPKLLKAVGVDPTIITIANIAVLILGMAGTITGWYLSSKHRQELPSHEETVTPAEATAQS